VDKRRTEYWPFPSLVQFSVKSCSHRKSSGNQDGLDEVKSSISQNRLIRRQVCHRNNQLGPWCWLVKPIYELASDDNPPETIQSSLVFWRVGKALSKWVCPIEIISKNKPPSSEMRISERNALRYPPWCCIYIEMGLIISNTVSHNRCECSTIACIQWLHENIDSLIRDHGRFCYPRNRGLRSSMIQI